MGRSGWLPRPATRRPSGSGAAAAAAARAARASAAAVSAIGHTHTHTHTHTTQGQISNVISDQRPVQDRRTLSPQLVSRAHQNSPYFGTRAPERSTDKNRRYGCFASLIFADESTRHEKLLRAQLTRRVNVGG